MSNRPSAKPWDKPIRMGKMGANAEPETSFVPEPPIQQFTLVYETRGAQSRGRLIMPDGEETVTEWRAYDHGMIAGVHDLLQRWRRAGVLGSLGRIPRDVQRSR